MHQQDKTHTPAIYPALSDPRIRLEDVQKHLGLKSRNAVFARVKTGILNPPGKDGKFLYWRISDLVAYDEALKRQYDQPNPASS